MTAFILPDSWPGWSWPGTCKDPCPWFERCAVSVSRYPCHCEWCPDDHCWWSHDRGSQEWLSCLTWSRQPEQIFSSPIKLKYFLLAKWKYFLFLVTITKFRWQRGTHLEGLEEVGNFEFIFKLPKILKPSPPQNFKTNHNDTLFLGKIEVSNICEGERNDKRNKIPSFINTRSKSSHSNNLLPCILRGFLRCRRRRHLFHVRWWGWWWFQWTLGTDP